MLIRLDESLENIARPVDERLATAISLLLQSYREGNHLVVAKRRTFDALLALEIYSPAQFALLQRLARDSTFNAELMRAPLPGLRLVHELPQRHHDGVFLLREIEATNQLARSVIVAENLDDLNLLEFLVQAYLSETKSRFTTNFGKRAGGGNTTADVFRECIRSRRIALCVVDSDKKYPASNIGETANRCVRVDREEGYFKKLLVIDNAREIENLFGNTLLELVFEDDLEQLEQIFRLNQEERNFFDLKNGIKVYELLGRNTDPQLSAHWMFIFERYAREPTLCYVGCTSKGNCVCHVVHGLGQSIVSRSLRRLSELSARRACEILCANPSNLWRNLGKEVAEFSIASQRVATI